ncbi:carboxymuconolactone decarboxylase family protein [Streptomyces sp. SID5914]|nr:carboxymuconolactone decarboxylase family protein [Streptomyces sp. SID5914]MZG17096.1 carboxymuconolactone decarboxylase family protein [Streptomyces sp. SID5914]
MKGSAHMQAGHASRIKEQLDLSEELSELINRIQASTGAINVVLTTLHHPTLAKRYSRFGTGFINDGLLPARDRELMVLRTSWHCGSIYEWTHHNRLSLTCGITEKEIRRITESDLSGWEPADAELLAVVDALVDDHRLTEEQWASITERYSTQGAIETVLLVGHYVMLAGLLNSAGTQVEPGIDAPVPLVGGS